MIEKQIRDLLPLPYALRVGKVLAVLGIVDESNWQTLSREISVTEPAICAIGQGIWALELWHTRDLGLTPNAKALADAYAERYGGEKITDAALYAGDLVSAYCDLASDGIIEMGDPINVCASSHHPFFVGSVIAQQEGLPVYTVVCKDAGEWDAYKEGGAMTTEWEELARYAEGKRRQSVFKDVLGASCDMDDAREAALDLLDEEGYLLHPVAAENYYLSCLYREEAESRNAMITVAPYHPYCAPETLCKWLAIEKTGNVNSALRRLELETGWEIPAQLSNEEQATLIINAVRHKTEDKYERE